jgi:tungstate transport system substrate-binding protein
LRTHRRFTLTFATPLAAALAIALGSALAGGAEPPRSIVLATTTSVQDSGLLDVLLPVFHDKTGITVKVVAVGSGAALRMGEEGNADVLLTHAPEGELALVKSGKLVDRRPFMENYFVIAGPPEDPAGVAQAADAADAVRRIAAARAPFASRADDSGTHRRERALFQAAGLDPNASWEGFVRTGAGMGITLQVAGERRAYVLSDIATFVAFHERTNLVSLSRPDPALRNLYSVMRPNPERHPPGTLDVEDAVRFADFLVAPETLQRIRSFGSDDRGRPLFSPLLSSPSP